MTEAIEDFIVIYTTDAHSDRFSFQGEMNGFWLMKTALFYFTLAACISITIRQVADKRCDM